MAFRRSGLCVTALPETLVAVQAGTPAKVKIVSAIWNFREQLAQFRVHEQHCLE
jgi:hypothetical protein